MPYEVLYYIKGEDGRKPHVACALVDPEETELRDLIWFYNRNQVQTPNEYFKVSMVKAWEVFRRVFQTLDSEQKKMDAVSQLMAWYYNMYHFHRSAHHPGGTEYKDPPPIGEFSLDSLIPTEVRHSVRGPRMRGCYSSGKTVRI